MIENNEWERVVALPPVLGRNWKAQAILPFSPRGTQYDNRFPSYEITFVPEDRGTAVIAWDFLYSVESGAIRFQLHGNITIHDQDFIITSELVRLGVEAVRGNLPFYSHDRPIVALLENLTDYEIDLTITVPSLIVSKDFAERILEARMP